MLLTYWWVRDLPFCALFYGLILGIGSALDYYRQFRERELRASQLEAQLAQAQLQMLKMQLHPHFLFNTLNGFAAPVSPTTSILPYYAKVGASLGASVIPPKRLLQNVVEDLLMEGRGAAAREAYNTLVSGYGAPADGAELLARITDVERRPPPAETVESLLATPFPTPEEARAFIGEWVGDVRMTPEEPPSGKIRLKIQVVNGRVIGETVYHDAPDGGLVMRWEYLKITPKGMTWGFMNGMRPRGVILFEGTLEGDTLAGNSRFGGIDFRRPDGSPPPSPSFSFKRVRK